MGNDFDNGFVETVVGGINYLRREKKIEHFKEAKNHIESISNQHVKDLIYKHMREDAKTYSELFCQWHSPGEGLSINHDPEGINERPFSIYSPLALFYMHAPLEAQHQLTDLLMSLDPDEAAKLLAVSASPAIHNGQIVIEYASPEDKKKLGHFLKSRTGAQIKAILAERPHFGHSGKDLHHLSISRFCQIQDEETVLHYFEALGKLDTSDLLSTFRSDPSVQEYGVAMQILSRPVSEKVALGLLNLLTRLDNKSLSKVFSKTSFVHFITGGNLLHPIFKLYSTAVVDQTLSLLTRLHEKEIQSLLTDTQRVDLASPSGAADKATQHIPEALQQSVQTPLHFAFNRTDNPKIAMQVIRAIESSPKLSQLLIDTSKGISPMQLAAKNNNVEAMTWLLEQESLSSLPRTKTVPTPFELAKQAENDTLVTLYEARPIFHAITHPIKGKSFKEYVPHLQKYPAIIQTRWSEQKTLLHLAAACGNDEAVQHLLAQGASPNALDEKGLTPLHHAIQSGHKQTILHLLNQDNLTLHIPNKDKVLPLQQLMPFLDYDLMTATFLAYQKNSIDSTTAHAYAITLSRLPQHTKRLPVLSEAFNTTSESDQSVSAVLKSYCDKHQDPISAFIVESADVLAQTNDAELLTASQVFIEAQLKTLTDDTRIPNKENARLNLVLFLFAMPPEKMIDFLESMTFDEEQRIQLEIVLCQAMVKPGIFSNLSIEQQRTILAIFSADSEAVTSIIAVHFRQSDLSQLPCELLIDFAKKLSVAELVKHSDNRPVAPLIILALDRLLHDAPRNSKKINALYVELQKKLAHFNAKDSSLALIELQQLLNIATHPETKGLIRHFISEQTKDSPIRQKIMTLFATYSKETVLIKDGLLRELMVEFANDAELMRAHPNNQFALSALLPVLTIEECLRIIQNQQAGTRQAELIDSLLSPALTASVDTPDPYILTHWLYQLDDQTARIALTQFVNEATQLNQEIMSSLTGLTQKQFQPLVASFTLLGKQLEQISNALIQTQFELGQPVYTEVIQREIQNLRSLCQSASEALIHANVQLKFGEKNPEVAAHCAQMPCLGGFFADDLEKTCLAIDKQQQNRAESLKTELDDKSPFSAVFQGAPNRPDIALITHATKNHTQKTKETIEGMNTNLLKGILNHPDSDALSLLSPWLKGQLNQGYLTHFGNLYHHLPLYLQETNPSTAQTINESLDYLLIRARSTLPLVEALQNLIKQNPSVDEVIALFLRTDESMLHDFITLTGSAQCHDLNRLASFVAAGRAQEWGMELLSNAHISATTNHVNAWMTQSLSFLSNYTSSVLSLRAVITASPAKHAPLVEKLSEFTQFLQQHPMKLQSEAIQCFIQSYEPLLEDDLQSESMSAIVNALSALMQHADHDQKLAALCLFKPKNINVLLEYCLSGAGSDNSERANSCKALLTNLCQYQMGLHRDAQELIKRRLGQQDLELIGDSQLISIAKSVLSEKNQLDGLTIDGVWIQRLLTSPRFIAASTPEVIERLSQRYRAISLTLKQDELEQLNTWLSGKMPFAERHNENLKRIQQEIAANPERHSHLLAKRERLLNFMINDSIRALFNQLEDNCLALRDQGVMAEAQLADTALDVFYTYQSQSVASLRSDKLFRLTDFIYSSSVLGRGDIAVAKNSLLSWLERHLPHRNFQQNELMRKTEVWIYNEAGKKIGYLDESNHAMAWISDEPCSLIDAPDMYAGMPLFDKYHQRMGTLNALSQLLPENLFRNDTVALIIGKMPISALNQSEAALDLLISDLLFENSLETTYQCPEAAIGTEKRIWLEQEVTHRIAKSDKPLQAATLATLIQYHSDENIFELLATTQNQDNAHALFSALLADEAKRTLLFSPQYQPALFQFLKKQDAKNVLSHFLSHHDKDWFNQGLECFAAFANQNEQPDLLSEALLILSQKSTAHEVAAAEFDALLKKLVASENTVRIVLQFLNDSFKGRVQEMDEIACDNLSQFFEKCHLTDLIQSLNQRKSWENSAQHRLLVMILNQQYKRLFPAEELRLSARAAWQAPELSELTRFTVRHLALKSPADKEARVGNILLTELAFRAANFGQTQLFYTAQGQINAAITTHTLKRGLLERLAALFYVPESIRSTINKMHHTLRGWFDSSHKKTHEITQMLKENHAIIDWKKLAETTWDTLAANQLPLICAYLINYSGKPDDLNKLIQDLFSSKALLENRANLYPITQLMMQFPHRDFSAVIFKALEDKLSKTPKLLDNTLFSHLIQYHQQAHLRRNSMEGSPNQELSLLKHFGQQQHYSLVHQCCVLMKPLTKQNGLLRAKLATIAKEARVEGSLIKHVDRWFFGIVRFFKRGWNYNKAPSLLVKFCDDPSSYENPEKNPEKVKTAVPGGQFFTEQVKLHEKIKKLRSRYESFLNKQKANKPDEEAGRKKTKVSDFSMFNGMNFDQSPEFEAKTKMSL